MTDLDFAPILTGTPLQRAAGKLQRALPPGWRVEVVDGPRRDGRTGPPVLRLVLPDAEDVKFTGAQSLPHTRG